MIKFANKKDLPKNIETERNLINQYISRQIDLSNELISSIKIFKEDIFKEFINYLTKIKENLELFDNLKNKLDTIQKANSNKKKRNIISDYNESYSTSILEMLNTKLQVKDFIMKNKVVEKPIPINEVITNKEVNTNNNYIENTLVISEITGTVTLPYKLNELNKELAENSEYNNIDEIITKEYTRPLKYYKYSAISRFREAFDLALNKSHLSYLKALSLGLELLTNFNLHPAIITACKTIDELDIYLSCLEDNELDDFNIFDIKFEMLPQVSKNKNRTITQNG